METQKQTKTNKVRIILNENIKKILAEWKNNLEKNVPGINVSYQQLVAWAVERIGTDLSKKEQVLIRNRFFDEVRQLEWLLAKAKAAKMSGEALDLTDFFKSETKTKRPISSDSVTDKEKSEN